MSIAHTSQLLNYVAVHSTGMNSLSHHFLPDKLDFMYIHVHVYACLLFFFWSFVVESSGAGWGSSFCNSAGDSALSDMFDHSWVSFGFHPLKQRTRFAGSAGWRLVQANVTHASLVNALPGWAGNSRLHKRHLSCTLGEFDKLRIPWKAFSLSLLVQ